MSHLFFSGEMSPWACSGALACCPGLAHCWVQHTQGPVGQHTDGSKVYCLIEFVVVTMLKICYLIQHITDERLVEHDCFFPFFDALRLHTVHLNKLSRRRRRTISLPICCTLRRKLITPLCAVFLLYSRIPSSQFKRKTHGTTVTSLKSKLFMLFERKTKENNKSCEILVHCLQKLSKTKTKENSTKQTALFKNTGPCL